MYIECDNMGPILMAFELLARGAASPGDISAMSLQVQLIEQDRPLPAAGNHRQALRRVLDQQLPSEWT
jgi:hypothetical protein